jgi:fermentation-respiration switch protein FrsA (DUF1100 family)
MNKALKKTLKGAAIAGAAYLAVGEVIYETFVNIDFHNWLGAATGIFNDPEKSKFFEQCTLLHEANDWYDAVTGGDTEFFSQRLHRNTYAKVYFQSEPTDRWAIVNHGYTDTPKTMAIYAKTYFEHGYNVVVPYMIGHGPDKSRYTTMGFKDKFVVLDWIDYVLELNKDAGIVLHGHSMGAATTMITTGEVLPANVVAAVADCGYTSCWDEYSSQVGPMMHLPAAPVVTSANIVSKLRGNFDFKDASPIKAVVNSRTPTLFIHGDADTFVPYSMMQPLYEACGAPDKQMLTVAGAAHAVSVYVDYDLYWNTVKEFIGKYIEF